MFDPIKLKPAKERPHFVRVWDLTGPDGRQKPENVLPGDVCFIIPDVFNPNRPAFLLSDFLDQVGTNKECHFIVVTSHLEGAARFASEANQWLYGTGLGRFSYPDNLWILGAVSNEFAADYSFHWLKAIPAKVKGVMVDYWEAWSERLALGVFDSMQSGETCFEKMAVASDWVVLGGNNHRRVAEAVEEKCFLCDKPLMSLANFEGNWPKGFEEPALRADTEEVGDDGFDLL